VETGAHRNKSQELAMKVENIMTRNVVCCRGDTKLEDVARLMADYDCGAVPIVDDERTRRVVGIVTDRDIVCRSLAAGKDPRELKASDCMTAPVHTCERESLVDDCLGTMEVYNVRRVPVLDREGACCGIVTLTNVAAAMPTAITGNLVKDLTEPLRHVHESVAGGP
jgi:CBS domain-containing protein